MRRRMTHFTTLIFLVFFTQNSLCLSFLHNIRKDSSLSDQLAFILDPSWNTISNPSTSSSLLPLANGQGNQQMISSPQEGVGRLLMPTTSSKKVKIPTGKNYVLNPDFNLDPFIEPVFHIFTSIKDWQSLDMDPVYLYKGSAVLPEWGSSTLLELKQQRALKLKQTINLPSEDSYVICGRYSLGFNQVDEAKFRYSWNGQSVTITSPKGSKIREFCSSPPVQGKMGENILLLLANSGSIMVNHIVVAKFTDQVKPEVGNFHPEKQKESEEDQDKKAKKPKNRFKNGDFNRPKFSQKKKTFSGTQIPEWNEANQGKMMLGKGIVFNSKVWKTDAVVAQLIIGANGVTMVTHAHAKHDCWFKLSFNYAANDRQRIFSSAVVSWNGVDLSTVKPKTTSDLYIFRKDVQGKAGLNKFSIRGIPCGSDQNVKEGFTFTYVSLVKTGHPKQSQISPIQAQRAPKSSILSPLFSSSTQTQKGSPANQAVGSFQFSGPVNVSTNFSPSPFSFLNLQQQSPTPPLTPSPTQFTSSSPTFKQNSEAINVPVSFSASSSPSSPLNPSNPLNFSFQSYSSPQPMSQSWPPYGGQAGKYWFQNQVGNPQPLKQQHDQYGRPLNINFSQTGFHSAKAQFSWQLRGSNDQKGIQEGNSSPVSPLASSPITPSASLSASPPTSPSASPPASPQFKSP